MKSYHFNEIIDRSGTFSCKWDQLPPRTPDGALSLWVADMDFPCADPILDAIRARLDRQILGYTIYDTPDCKKAVSSWFRRRFNWEIPEDEIFYSPGVVPALAFLVDFLTHPGDSVLIQRPVYYPFTQRIEGTGRHVVNNPLQYSNGHYQIDFDDLDEKMSDPSVKGMILCSPHNPVGRVWTEEELSRTVDICQHYEKWIISDEIHCDLTRKGIVHHPLLKVRPDYKDRIIACTAPSKTFNLAGMQLSNIVIPNPDYQRQWIYETETRYGLDSVNPLSVAAMIAAYSSGEEWLEQVLTYIDGNVQFVREFLTKYLPKAILSDSEGTYLVWIDLRAYCTDEEKLEKLVLEKAGLVLDEGYIFGKEGAGFERINVACPRSILEDCMKRLAHILTNC